MKAFLEIHATQGGDDSKLLVEDMATNYMKVAAQNNLNISAYS